jgi:hypothetical protein
MIVCGKKYDAEDGIFVYQVRWTSEKYTWEKFSDLYNYWDLVRKFEIF